MKYILLLLALFLFNLSVHAEEDERKSFFDGTKTIHLRFTDIIDDKYTVDILWTPYTSNRISILITPPT
jgi:hypothetical protein